MIFKKSRTEIDHMSVLRDLAVLCVEDNESLRKGMTAFLRLIFDRVIAAENGQEGLELFMQHHPDLVVTDIRMPVMDGLEMAREIKKSSPNTAIIIVTGFSEVEFMMDAIEIGIDRFVQKPVDEDVFIDALYKCGFPLVQEHRLESLNDTIHHSLVKRLGSSPKILDIIKQIRQVAHTDFSVVLQGETGVGKSMIAGIIHELSHRVERPFVTVDIGSIPETLVESELFGHKKGAFTGAARDQKGFLEISSGGTIFFDDLQNMSPQVQAKLLQTVEKKQVYPLGSTTPVDIDVRIICATNVDFRRIVEEKKFREDLYYRLDEFNIVIPPLRERRDDIKLLASRFFSDAIQELNKKILEITPDAIETLENCEWPGNVRQLKNVMRRAVLLCESTRLRAECIKKVMKKKQEIGDTEELTPVQIPHQVQEVAAYSIAPDSTMQPVEAPPLELEELEKWAIREALRRSKGKRMRTALLLRIDYKRLIRKMKKYGISSSEDRSG